MNDGTYFSKRLTVLLKKEKLRCQNDVIQKLQKSKALDSIISPWNVKPGGQGSSLVPKQKKTSTKKQSTPPKNLFFGMFFSGEKVSLAKNHHPLLS